MAVKGIERLRASMLPLVEGWGRSRGLLLPGAVVTPVGRGKKAMVFLVNQQGGGLAFRVFGDPLRVVRYLRAYQMLDGTGVRIPRLVFLFTTPHLAAKGVLALSVEERVSPVKGISSPLALALGRCLGRLHRICRGRWGGLFLPSRGSYSSRLLENTLSRVKRWERHFGVCLGPGIEDWVRSWEPALLDLERVGYSLIHGDIALANMGMTGNELLLLDLVRLRYAFALEDVVSAIDMLFRQAPGRSAAVTDAFWDGYRDTRPVSEDERALLPFFQAVFHAKRLNRALKHICKGETEWHLRAAWHMENLSALLKKKVP